MKYAIFSDIHSNFDALVSVLKECEKEKIDRFINAGDIIGYGVEPEKCIDEMIKINAVSVYGNHEAGFRNLLSDSWFSENAYISLVWHKNKLKNKYREYIYKLKINEKVGIFDIYHSSPYEPKNFYYLYEEKEILYNFKFFNSKVAIVGHTHIPFAFYYNKRKKVYGYVFKKEFNLEDDTYYIINPGSVGQPRDKNPLASFAIYDSKKNLFKFKRVEYNIDNAIKKILKAGLPENLGFRLKFGV